MRVGDEVVDLGLIFDEERFDVLYIKHACALCLRKDKVDKEDQADVAVEGDHPGDNREVGFDKEEEGENGPILEPGYKKGWRGCAKGFVGEVGGKENGDDGAEKRDGFSLSIVCREALDGVAYEMRLGTRSNMAGCR